MKNKKIQIINLLKKKGIGTSIYYPQPVPRMTYYKKKYGYKNNFYKNASEISDFSISFPVGPHVSKKDVLYITKNLKNILK